MLIRRAARRAAQTLSLALFLGFLIFLPPFWADIFLRLDPLAGLLAPIAGRAFIESILPALLVIISAFFLGRAFCGWICPMGATLDAGGSMIRHLFKGRRYRPKQAWSYVLLTAMVLAAFCGLNLYFWGSPIALVTRFYALALDPLASAAAAFGLDLADPVLRTVNLERLSYLQIEPRVYHGAWLVGFFWMALFGLELLAPRFWCRSLCPAGAILSLCSRFSFLKRRADSKCTHCGKCQRICPMDAIGHKGAAEAAGSAKYIEKEADPGKCVLCGACADICPKGAVKYSFASGTSPIAAYSSEAPFTGGTFSRRAFCAGALAAGAIAGVSLVAGEAVKAAPLIRAPGSRPEYDFLSRCMRCGECMAACPDHALQPVIGQGGIFSPYLDPYSGGCDPDCNLCGHVCPTQAIIGLPLEQKRWAKTGTATISRTACLAWGQDKRCMVCKENCPYDAVRVIAKEGYNVPVPLVEARHCYGCGFCQKACPVRPAAIVVEPMGAIRLNDGNYEQVAKLSGIELSSSRLPGVGHGAEPGADDLPPGFTE